MEPFSKLQLPSTASLLLLVTLATIYVVSRKWTTASRRIPLPPGPKGFPIIGNVLDLPKSQGWYTFTKWAKEYGPLVYVEALSQPMLIINTQKIAIDLLEKRGAIYSDRPYLAMGGDLVGWDQGLAIKPYGEEFKRMRKLASLVMGGKNTSAEFASVGEKETAKLLLRLLESPEEFREHIRATTGAIILRMSYGYVVDPRPGQDPLVSLVATAVEQFSESTAPGRYLVDIAPILKHVPAWFPGAGFKKTATEWRKNRIEMCEVPYQMVRENIAKGVAAPSFTRTLLETHSIDSSRHVPTVAPADEHTIKWTMASLYSGGADTTVSAISTFFLAMAMNPHVMRKAQEELDRVIGQDRLPSVADRESLVYVDALCKEVLRWGPVGPINVPHRSMQEDVYEGQRIPKNALILVNIWAIMHDESVYKDPDEFIPERFLVDRNLDSRLTAFGYGRRICPGKILADLSLFLSVAMTLHVFDITSIPEEPPRFRYTDGVISHPEPFRCRITPRSKHAEELIREVAFEDDAT